MLNTGETLLMMFLVPLHAILLSIPVWIGLALLLTDRSY
jgi:hypothetical protein